MLQHVSLEVRAGDVEACVAFWALLGFRAVPAPGGLRGSATWLQRGPTHIHLLHTDTPVAPPRGHCAVVAEDYDATLRALREAGFVPEAGQELWGAARCFMRDPAGHRVEVMSAPPPTG